MNPRADPTLGLSTDRARQAANRRLGWSLAIFAVALFLVTMLLRS